MNDNLNKNHTHSPGPWTPGFHDANLGHTGMGCGYGQSQIIDGLGRAIAGVAMVEPNEGDMYHNRTFSQAGFDQLEANTALIAAAPDLLAACEQMIDALQCGRIGEGDVYWLPCNSDVMSSIRAAVAKASLAHDKRSS